MANNIACFSTTSNLCIVRGTSPVFYSPKLGLHGTVQYVRENTTCRSIFLSVTLNTELESGCGSYSKTESSRKCSKTCFPKHLKSSLINALFVQSAHKLFSHYLACMVPKPGNLAVRTRCISKAAELCPGHLNPMTS